MPELPEVENVARSLIRQGAVGQSIAAVELLRKNLRTPLKKDLITKLPGQSILSIRRRAKFLIFETDDFALLSHLGMTGSWRPVANSFKPEKHDHIVIHFTSGLNLVFNDPRRFGLFEMSSRSQVERNPWLDHLGVEPLESEFTGEMLFQISRGRKAPLKGFIMDQRRVVGVGNIYASEALFRAQIKPTRPAGKLKKAEASRLVDSVRTILAEAIESGGSTIRDYRNSEGTEGEFQKRFSVYDRAGQPCLRCQQPAVSIKSRMIAGRNTFWCPRCQF